jgi:hypothetical protein
MIFSPITASYLGVIPSRLDVTVGSTLQQSAKHTRDGALPSRRLERAGFGATARLLSSDLSAVIEKFLYKSKDVRSEIVR